MAAPQPQLDYVASVERYASNVDAAAVQGIVKYLSIALHNRDSSLVAASDPKELARVRDSFVKKKLGLTQADAELDAAINDVMATMSGERNKSRVTVYYLLAEKFGKLGLFANLHAAATIQPTKIDMAERALKTGANSGTNISHWDLKDIVSVVEECAEATRRAVKRSRVAAEDLIDDAAGKIKLHPLQTVALTFGLALGTGALLGWIASRNHKKKPALLDPLIHH